MSHREHRVKLKPVRLGVRNRVWIEGEFYGRVYDGGGLLRAFCRDRRGSVDGALRAGPWGDEPDGRVQAGRVVIVDGVAGDPLGLLDIKRCEGADGLILQGLVEALKFAVGLRVVWAGHDVAGLPLGNEGLELAAFELGSLVGESLRDRQTKTQLEFKGQTNKNIRWI